VTGPVALVTGGNRGLGRSTAHALARTHRLVVVYRTDDGSADEAVRSVAARGGDAIALQFDIADVERAPAFADSVRSAIDARWGAVHLDVLVNNAGVGTFESFGDVTPAGFDRVVGTNLRGTFFLIQALAPLLAGGGHIVNVSTSLTRHVSPASSVYAASKAAVEMLARALTPELGALGIRINSVAPGPTATDFNGGAMRDDDGLRSAIIERSPLGRVGEPEDVGDAIAALVSPAMRWVGAERLEVSGGSFL